MIRIIALVVLFIAILGPVVFVALPIGFIIHWALGAE